MKNILREGAIYSTNEAGPNEINIGSKNQWIIQLTPKGIFFNHKEFPDFTANDFVKQFIEILERNFKIRFEPKD